MRRALSAAGWLVLAVLALIGIDVWLGPTAPTLVALVGLAPWLFFAAWPVGIAAALLRGRALGVAALVVIAVQVFVLLPSFAPWHSPPPSAAGTTFGMLDANVRFNNHDLTGLGHQIEKRRPAVVALEELSPPNLASLRATGALAPYPYHLVLAREGGRGYGLWSTFPLEDAGTWTSDGAEMVQATVHAPGGTMRLLVVHTIAPPANGAVWARNMRDLAAKIRSGERPMLVVGDLNATVAMKQMRGVLDAGVRDAADADGHGWHMTWSPGDRMIVPVLRLDHALFTSGITITGYHVGSDDGSDHLPLWFTVGRTPR